MASIYIDYENTLCTGTDGLKGVKYLTPEDSLRIYYSQPSRYSYQEKFDEIEKTGCDLEIIKLVKTGKNALDSYIISDVALAFMGGENAVVIVSKDKGYNGLKDYYRLKSKDFKIAISTNIELGLQALEEGERSNRITEAMMKVDLASGYARIVEKRRIKQAIEDAFIGTKHEDSAQDIALYFCDHNFETGIQLYNRTVHKFGKEDGREIFHILKKAI